MAEKSTAKPKASTKKTVKAVKTTAKSKSTAKGKYLLIMESPSKARTVQKYLGEKYEVLSSKGHIRDLPSSRLGVDVDNGFEPDYIVSRKDKKSEVLRELKKAAAASSKIYLATDPDREGEAIAWHLAQLLGLDESAPIRVTFNEVTKKAVTAGVTTPREIDKNMVSAQQARRVLDRLVGYKLSPFLWKKVKKGLSAGRVQSVATRLIVDREREIEAFVPDEYWTLDAIFEKAKKEWVASFYGTAEKKIVPSSENEMNALIDDITDREYTVLSVKKSERVRQPYPPFTTSSLQQDASVRLNMRPKRTMSIAQSLYEGVEVKGHGMVGLITYMRTDSLRISEEAQAAARDYITREFGANFYPPQPRIFKTKQTAQDAHEAIRPTYTDITPAEAKESLTSEQYRLYKLIWERFIASQMAAAIYAVTNVETGVTGKSGAEYIFKASDSKLSFPGFTLVYGAGDEEKQKKLPELKEGEHPLLKQLVPEQKFTQPPSRYTEGSLVKTLEENGIGRPSTFATIVSTIIDRMYVEREGKILKPTQLGFITTDLMKENFNNIVDIAFTAGMEEKLDNIAVGQKTYLETMTDFYGGFKQELDDAEKKFEGVKIDVPNEESDVVCEKCGSKMVYKNSRFGRFLACPNYPECKNTKSIVVEAAGKCPVCGSKMTVRRSKNGKTYYACEKGTECGFMTWDLPVSDVCPRCGSTLFRKFGKLLCHKEGCDYEGKAEK